MREKPARKEFFSDTADCLRSLAQFRTNAAHALMNGPASEIMAVKLLDLAKKLDETDAAGVKLKVCSSERALLMEAFTTMAPLLEPTQTHDVSPREMAERQRCSDTIRSILEWTGAPTM